MECTVSSHDSVGPEIFDVNIVKARKQHKCCECHSEIISGEKYQHIKGMWDHEFYTYKTCISCAELRKELEDKLDRDECIEYGGLGCAYASYLREEYPECYQ